MSNHMYIWFYMVVGKWFAPCGKCEENWGHWAWVIGELSLRGMEVLPLSAGLSLCLLSRQKSWEAREGGNGRQERALKRSNEWSIRFNLIFLNFKWFYICILLSICNQNCLDLLLWEALVFTKSLNSFGLSKWFELLVCSLDGALLESQRRAWMWAAAYGGGDDTTPHELIQCLQQHLYYQKSIWSCTVNWHHVIICIIKTIHAITKLFSFFFFFSNDDTKKWYKKPGKLGLEYILLFIWNHYILSFKQLQWSLVYWGDYVLKPPCNKQNTRNSDLAKPQKICDMARDNCIGPFMCVMNASSQRTAPLGICLW